MNEKEIRDFLIVGRTWKRNVWDWYHRIMHVFHTLISVPLNKLLALDLTFLRK